MKTPIMKTRRVTFDVKTDLSEKDFNAQVKDARV